MKPFLPISLFLIIFLASCSEESQQKADSPLSSNPSQRNEPNHNKPSSISDTKHTSVSPHTKSNKTSSNSYASLKLAQLSQQDLNSEKIKQLQNYINGKDTIYKEWKKEISPLLKRLEVEIGDPSEFSRRSNTVKQKRHNVINDKYSSSNVRQKKSELSEIINIQTTAMIHLTNKVFTDEQKRVNIKETEVKLLRLIARLEKMHEEHKNFEAGMSAKRKEELSKMNDSLSGAKGLSTELDNLLDNIQQAFETYMEKRISLAKENSDHLAKYSPIEITPLYKYENRNVHILHLFNNSANPVMPGHMTLLLSSPEMTQFLKIDSKAFLQQKRTSRSSPNLPSIEIPPYSSAFYQYHPTRPNSYLFSDATTTSNSSFRKRTHTQLVEQSVDNFKENPSIISDEMKISGLMESNGKHLQINPALPARLPQAYFQANYIMKEKKLGLLNSITQQFTKEKSVRFKKQDQQFTEQLSKLEDKLKTEKQIVGEYETELRAKQTADLEALREQHHKQYSHPNAQQQAEYTRLRAESSIKTKYYRLLKRKIDKIDQIKREIATLSRDGNRYSSSTQFDNIWKTHAAQLDNIKAKRLELDKKFRKELTSPLQIECALKVRGLTFFLIRNSSDYPITTARFLITKKDEGGVLTDILNFTTHSSINYRSSTLQPGDSFYVYHRPNPYQSPSSRYRSNYSSANFIKSKALIPKDKKTLLISVIGELKLAEDTNSYSLKVLGVN